MDLVSTTQPTSITRTGNKPPRLCWHLSLGLLAALLLPSCVGGLPLGPYAVDVSTEVYGEALVHADWQSTEVESIDLMLDLYEPEGAPAERPAVVLIHGGGFTGGTRAKPELVDFAYYFVSRGWVAISIDYRVAGDRGTVPASWVETVQDEVELEDQEQGLAMYPAARDAKAAVRWLHAEAERLQVDTSRITAIGGSAGSYLALMLGTSDEADFRGELSLEEDPTLSSTHLDQPSTVHTVIDHWGGAGHLLLLEAMDGVSRFDETDAPVSIIHGTEDRTVEFGEAELIAEEYEATGVPYDFHPLAGIGHGAWDVRIDGLALPELAYDFIVTHQGSEGVE